MLILAVGVPLLLACVAIATERLFIVSPLFLFAVFFGLFISPELTLGGTDRFVLLTTIGALAFALGYLLTRMRRRGSPRGRSPAASDTPSFDWRALPRISGLLLVCLWIGAIAIIFFGTSFTQDVDLADFLVCPICETSRTGKQNVAVPTAIQFGAVAVMDFLSWLYLRQKVSYGRALLFGAMRALAYVSSFGTGRVLVIVNFGLPLLLTFVLKQGRPKRLGQLLLLAAGAIVLLPVLYLMNELRHGSENLELTVQAAFTSFGSDLGPGANLKALISYVDTNGYDYGFFLVSPLIALLPRMFFPAKPITSLQFYYTQRIFYEDPVFDVTTYTFTLFDSYTALGLASAVLVTALYGVVFALVYEAALRIDRPVACIFGLEVCLLSVNIFRTNLFDALPTLLLRVVLLYGSFGLGRILLKSIDRTSNRLHHAVRS